MTTITRRWNYAPIVLGVFLVLAASNANAEEDAVYNAQATQQQQQVKPQKAQSFDQQYKLPPSYQGKYYPNDDTAIGYHGTRNSAQNDASGNGSYYYYYY